MWSDTNECNGYLLMKQVNVGEVYSMVACGNDTWELETRFYPKPWKPYKESANNKYKGSRE